MNWEISNRFDREALPLADRHYNRQKIGSPQFVPPGRCVVLLSRGKDALWVSSWPYAEYTKHEWAGAWICSCFRNESDILSSILITEAIAATRSVWGDPPSIGMITFVDASKVRRKRDPGRCFLRAGFQLCGRTKVNGLLAFQLLPDAFPKSKPPIVPCSQEVFRFEPSNPIAA